MPGHLEIYLILVGVVVVPVVLLVLVLGRSIASSQAAKRRDRMILERISPLIKGIESGKDPDHFEIDELAQQADTRRVLYEQLQHLGREDLFPKQYITRQFAAEADLVHWLLHPNALGRVPDAVELMTIVNKEHRGRHLEYYVFRYRVFEPHWGATDGWLVGVAGPYLENTLPYGWTPGTFSTFEKYESKPPDEHVNGVHDRMMRQQVCDNLFEDQRQTYNA